MNDRRPERPRQRVRFSEQEWEDAAERVLLEMLAREESVTIREIEARGSDRVYDPEVWPHPINPHHFTNARNRLGDRIVETAEPSTGHPVPISTWSLRPRYGQSEAIKRTAARKRLLTARHAGWAKRGSVVKGVARGLIGGAGEDAAHAAMLEAQTAGIITRVSGATRTVLRLATPGEIDNTAWYLDESTDSPVPILIVVEVKNTRDWHYPNSREMLHFLEKAATIQADHPDVLMMPLFAARQCQYTTWALGQEHGFLPASAKHQVVKGDFELTPERFEEVRAGLGFEDMILTSDPTPQLRGLMATSIPKYALERAELWAEHHHLYLPGSAVDPASLF